MTWINAAGLRSAQLAGMDRSNLYRCPNTGQVIETSIRASSTADEREYIPLRCTSCGRIHLINRATGKLLSEKKAPREEK